MPPPSRRDGQGRDPSTSPRGRNLPFLALLAATLVVKATVLAQLHHHPLLQPQEGLDSGAYVRLAQRVAGGDLALGPEPYYVSPFYIYFLALVFSLTGSSLLAVKLVQILLGTAAVGLVCATARQWLGERAGWMAALLAAATGLFTFHEVLLLQAAVDPFLTALVLYLLTRALASGRGRAFVATGLALGLLVLNRPNALSYAGALPLLLTAVPHPARRWRPSAALLLGLALALAPVALRNLLVSGEPILVSSHGGLNFYIGNNPEADGTYHGVPGITPSIEGQARDAQRVAEAAMGRLLSAREASDYFYRRAWEWIRGNPSDAALLFARKLAYVLNATDLSLNYSYAYYSRDEPTLLRLLLVGPGLLVPLGLVGLWIRARAVPRDAFWVFSAFVPVYALSVAAFFVSGRYRLPLLVPLCVGAGAAVVRLFEAARERRLRPFAAPAAAAVALALVANRDLQLDDGRANERTEMILFLLDTGRHDEAKELLARTVATHPQPALLHLRVGQALVDAGRWAEAVPHLDAAWRAGVRPDLAGFDLARALAATGRGQEAVGVLREIPPPPETDIESRLALGRLAMELGAPDLAEGFLQPAVGRQPRSAGGREQLGLALALLGRRAEAAGHLEEAARLDPSSATARLNLAVVYAELGRVDEARARAEEALRLKPDYPQARALLADLARRR